MPKYLTRTARVAVAAALLSAAGSASTAMAAETVVDRSAFSTTVKAGGDAFTTRTYPEAVNFKDDDGDWTAIDRTLEPQSDGSVRPAAIDGDAIIPSTLTKPVVIEHDGRTVSFRLLGADADADREVSGTKASFDDALAGVDVSYKVRPNGLKELIKLSSSSSRRSFSYDVRADSDLTAAIEGRDVVFKDAAGTERFRVAAPIAWDSAEPKEATNALTLSVVKSADRQWRLTMRAGDEWLDDPARIYPVTLDPDYFYMDGYTRFHGANQDCEMAGGTLAGQSRCGLDLQIGYGNNRPYKSVMKFSDITGAIPAYATATAARFLAWQFPNNTAKANVSSRLRTVTRDWDDTATWDVAKTGTAWTTKGGDTSTDPNLTGPPITVGPSGYWSYWPAPLATINGWIKGTVPNYGFQISTDLTGPTDVRNAYGFTSTEGNQDSWPALEVTWVPDTTAPTAPSALAISGRDAADGDVVLGFTPGTDPANGGQSVSGLARTEVRHSINNGALTSWAPAAPNVYSIPGVAVGNTVQVQARSVDNAGNNSTVATANFTVSTDSLGVAFDDAATEYLVEEMGLTASVAQQWLDVQAAAGELETQILASASASQYYASISLDPLTQRVTVNVTNSAGTAPIASLAAQNGITSSMVYRVVAYTDGQLLDKAKDAQVALASDIDAGLVDVTYSSTSFVGVEFNVAAGASAAVRQRVSAAAAALAPVPTRTSDDTATKIGLTPAVCGPLNPGTDDLVVSCGPFTRGGVAMRASSKAGGGLVSACTTGFNAKSRSDGISYELTAGHCLKDAVAGAAWSIFNTDGTPQPIGTSFGTPHGGAYSKEAVDAGIIKLVSQNIGASSYIFAGRVSTGKVRFRRDPFYAVSKVQFSKPGQILCASGARTGTHCGQYKVLAGAGKQAGNIGYVQMCKDDGVLRNGRIKPGDSGGPVFARGSDHKAVAKGIISAYVEGHPCIMAFQSAKAAEDDQRVDINLTP